MSSFVKYINLENNSSKLLKKLNAKININKNIDTYNNMFLANFKDKSKINEYISDKLLTFIKTKYSQINKTNVEINYILEQINTLVQKKFSEVILELDIKHIISLLDYNLLENTNYLYWRNEYYKLLNSNILMEKYKPIKNTKKKLIKLIEINWKQINFNNIIGLSKSLAKLNFFGQNIDNFKKMLSDKFDELENIKKFVKYINKLELNLETTTEIMSELNKLTFIIDSLKSNGFLLFEEFYKQLHKKKNTTNANINKHIIQLFINIISKKEATTVNKLVNDILLKMRDYINDIEENNECNDGFKLITINNVSEKYKTLDLKFYDRNKMTFNILKFTHTNNTSKFNLTPQIEPYFDMYNTFYRARFPDREVEYNLIESTIIIKIPFLGKNYNIHMTLLQYLVFECIYNNNLTNNLINLTINYLSKTLNISKTNILLAVNSLLKVKLIKRTLDENINLIYFQINDEFTSEDEKISIAPLVFQKSENLTSTKTYLFDRDTVILANIYDYIKKNKIFYKDTMMTELQYKIPFKIKQIETFMQNLLDKRYIEKINDTGEDNIYKYCDSLFVNK